MDPVHIIGAGMAGLSCAVALTRRGRAVVLHEAAPHAGGRCRSFFDDTLGREIDNGNHLLLSGNRAAMGFLDTIGARDSLLSPARAVFPFVDLATGERWTVRPGRGRLPMWIFDPRRRVAGSRAADYLAALRLAVAGDRTVAECLDTGRPIYRRFWEPLAVAVLNTEATHAAARLLWPVLIETLGRGEAASRPCIARNGLSRSFVDPALAFLTRAGAEIRFGARLRRFEYAENRVTALDFGTDRVTLADDSCVVLAVPPAAAGALLPDLRRPLESRPIVNAHFRLPDGAAPATPEGLFFLGLIGGDADWLFLRGEIVSVTVSAARELVDRPAEEIARRLWHDVARALDLQATPVPACRVVPAYRIVKEKRATFAQTPAALALRPGPLGPRDNLVLAGDWTNTGLPATIEGAMRSGEAAAKAVLVQQ